jgi:hypothetical protein
MAAAPATYNLVRHLPVATILTPIDQELSVTVILGVKYTKGDTLYGPKPS